MRGARLMPGAVITGTLTDPMLGVTTNGSEGIAVFGLDSSRLPRKWSFSLVSRYEGSRECRRVVGEDIYPGSLKRALPGPLEIPRA